MPHVLYLVRRDEWDVGASKTMQRHAYEWWTMTDLITQRSAAGPRL